MQSSPLVIILILACISCINALSDWTICTTSASCDSKCCSKEYSNGILKCTPTGTSSQCLIDASSSSSSSSPSPSATSSKLGVWSRCTVSSDCASNCCSGEFSAGILKCHPAGSSSMCVTGTFTSSVSASASTTPTGTALLVDWSHCSASSACASGCCSGEWSAGILKCHPKGSSSQCLAAGTTASSTATSSAAPTPTGSGADWSTCTVNTQCTSGCCSREFSQDGALRCHPKGVSTRCEIPFGTWPTLNAPAPGRTGYEDWAACRSPYDCKSNCCSQFYSATDSLQCIPWGTSDPQACYGANYHPEELNLKVDWEWCNASADCASGCCSAFFSTETPVIHKCTPANSAPANTCVVGDGLGCIFHKKC